MKTETDEEEKLYAVLLITLIIILMVFGGVFEITSFPLSDLKLYSTPFSPTDIVIYNFVGTDESGTAHKLGDYGGFTYHTYIRRAQIEGDISKAITEHDIKSKFPFNPVTISIQKNTIDQDEEGKYVVKKESIYNHTI